MSLFSLLRRARVGPWIAQQRRCHQGRASERADPEDRGPPPCLARGDRPGAV